MKHVHGEIYLVTNEVKEWLDWFEGVSDKLYVCKKIDVQDNKTGQVHQAYAYLLEDFKEELLNENTVLFESYSSKNELFPEYEKFEDTPDNTYNLLKQLKKGFK
jgi:hypothetical protein